MRPLTFASKAKYTAIFECLNVLVVRHKDHPEFPIEDYERFFVAWNLVKSGSHPHTRQKEFLDYLELRLRRLERGLSYHPVSDVVQQELFV